MHSRLVEHGFLSYVAQVKAKHGKDSLLFPLREKIKGRMTVGDACSKWFQRYREKIGVKGKKPLHSFRHTVVTRLISAGVPQDRVMMVVGTHRSDDHRRGLHGSISGPISVDQGGD